MLIHQLPALVQKKKKRLGRGLGSGAGAKSGRGTTRHQRSRESIPLHFEGGQNKITKKFPLLRGKGRNKSIFMKPVYVNVEKLNKLKENTRVDIKTLVDNFIVPETSYKYGAKILGRGKLNVSLIVTLPVSKLAKIKIEKAGGKLIEV
ncbi:50S ribosomal protein L15 [Candidatus Roizmanbacteria bacterium RIFCSPLOWO2_01_FULL_42_14]|uniref:Large ribosomal subunit protein uL15 n=4 Tax=Candidatus Roizmaniibacteriota TaxID=1752723 RepID=A0A1F7JV10_9BACT|nr:MAG: 50S ribosomal protein L15 [Candidatus Roizmanbacteria bacterium RIFCSPHIGHO2_02_FULL_43_11]OGK38611.1 MAG: 50S ribosomal protein L15 [Candidatus Roizmanbacteria bacterium RIFCSPHIGHO2_12_FULL_42_10]OGK52205.1 MAG: 50S ribosomal protein L15 [Candidatus Roizmanbacteria bacterium RIFCSPLOWO2_01_FULL_42_14]OGK59438.1 MAG: 50S ribosomal protein L15 [Candidatus Roizmanbacteria bacterium RIFCSPLOWO2_02_FULL_43_10]